jgi:hypothetical protein
VLGVGGGHGAGSATQVAADAASLRRRTWRDFMLLVFYVKGVF